MMEESFFQATNWLNTCGMHEITLISEKLYFAQDIVEFVGFKITSDPV